VNWKKIAADFPINNNFIWLNNAGHVPPGQHAIEAVNRFMQAHTKSGFKTYSLMYPQPHKRVKSILSGLLNCSEDDVALIHNTAEGMNFFSHGLNFSSGDKVLLPEQEYPSNVYPWEHVKENGVSISFIPNSNTQDGFIRNLKEHITPDTKAVSLSAVHWCTGMPFPLKEISSICQENDTEFVVDISQGAGHVPVYIDDWDIPFCTGSAWKWLHGPLGLGILVIKKDKINSLSHIFKGTQSVVSSHNYFPYKSELKDNVDRYVFSTPSLIDWIYFEASLSYLSNIGFDTIANRIYELSDYLSGQLSETGFTVLNKQFAPVKSGIIAAEHEKVSSKKIVDKLKAKNIICADRFNRVRFSVHIFNTFDQIDRTVSILKKIVS